MILQRISDEVDNQAQSGIAPLVIFVGGGLDYGDAPSPYPSTAAQGGPRHFVDNNFALWKPDPTNPDDRPITPDADAQLPNADEDNGVFALGTLQPGFSVNFEVSVHNPELRDFYLDAWFDWNANGVFEATESLRFGSIGTIGRPIILLGDGTTPNGTGTILVNVPFNAVVGETFARFRLSQEEDNLGPTGDAPSGEVEDIRLVITNNPFQNPVLRHDVNDSGSVTPVDALQIINAIGRNNGDNILLDVPPLPPGLPPFPDVSGDSVVSALDALQVINQLALLPSGNSPPPSIEGESTTFVPVQGGVMASGATLLGDALIAASVETEVTVDEPASPPSTVAETPTKTSVFDTAPVVAVESIVDSIAEDAASARGDEEHDALDQLFASF